MDLYELGGLVFALGEIDGHELVGDPLLFADQGNETSASGPGVTVEFEDHGKSQWDLMKTMEGREFRWGTP